MSSLHLLVHISPGCMSSSKDQRVCDGNGGGSSSSLAKPESSSVSAGLCGSSDGRFLAAGDGDDYAMGWMPSKMRFIQKMKTDNDPNHHSGPTNNDSKTIRNGIRSDDRDGDGGGIQVTRVCSDCNTTTTPLWRSGPRGPKSLCNACGIRQRKARRAMEGFDGSKVHNKEKKSRGEGHSVLGQTCKKTTNTDGDGDGLFGNFSVLRGSFPRDVTEAAILLMDLSCGFAHT